MNKLQAVEHLRMLYDLENAKRDKATRFADRQYHDGVKNGLVLAIETLTGVGVFNGAPIEPASVGLPQ